MARLPFRGVAYQCLYEVDGTLREIMASLGLKPLSKSAERKLRLRLGFALGLYEAPKTAIQVDEVVTSLKSHARALEKVAQLDAAAREGLAAGHDIALSGHLIHSLSEDPTICTVEAAQSLLAEFCDRARMIASTARFAATKLASTVGKDGRSRYDWHDGFTAALIDICKQNGIEPKAGIDRYSGEPVGRLIEIAAAFERLLLPKMRSPSPEALAKRLRRSLERLRSAT